MATLDYISKECCSNMPKIKAILYIKESDIKSKEPLKIKRKYGKFTRDIIKVNQ